MIHSSSTQPQTVSDSSQHTQGMELSQREYTSQGVQSSIKHRQQSAPRGGGGCGVVTENIDELRIRYLTPRECLRLMGFDDPSIDRLMAAVPSKTNQYKLAGNSIVVDCLEHIFKAIYIDKSFRKPRPKQISLFDIPEKRVNPILMRDAETIEKEVSNLNIRMGRIKDKKVEDSTQGIVEKGGDYVVGVTDCDE